MSCRIWFKTDENGNLVFIEESEVPNEPVKNLITETVEGYIIEDEENLKNGITPENAYSNYYSFCLKNNKPVGTYLAFQEIMSWHCEQPVLKLLKH